MELICKYLQLNLHLNWLAHSKILIIKLGKKNNVVPLSLTLKQQTDASKPQDVKVKHEYKWYYIDKLWLILQYGLWTVIGYKHWLKLFLELVNKCKQQTQFRRFLLHLFHAQFIFHSHFSVKPRLWEGSRPQMMKQLNNSDFN